ncbi:hypothetical protein BKH45_04770 [Helicobacter sp. 11S03491-1]|nr:hypothetical protein BKH45_04770 [Helicobacter sp. 11S03491-1]
MKESWEVARLFEEERERFAQEVLSYKNEIAQAKIALKEIRHKVIKYKNQIKTLEDTKEEKTNEINQIKQEIFKQKIKKNLSKLRSEKHQIIHEKREEILPKPLETIDIYLKDGTIAKARPVKKTFTDTLYKKYRILLKENKMLQEQILDFELENSKLKIELRDFYAEDILKANEYSKNN